MNTASNTRLRLTTKVGQAHVATGVPLDLGTNTPPTDPRNAAENQTSSLQTHTGQTGEHNRSDWSLLVKTEQLPLSGSTPVRPVKHIGQTDGSLKAPKAPNRPTDH
jgi:hypothetical protein